MKDHHIWITTTCAYLTSVSAFLGQVPLIPAYHPSGSTASISPLSRQLQQASPTFVLYAQKKTPKPPTSPPPESKKSVEYTSDNGILPSFNNVVNELVTPLFGRSIEKGVSGDVIKGASIVGATVGLVSGAGPVGAAILSAGAAYTAISPGKGGQAARFVGEASWDATNSAVKMYNDFDTTTKITGATQAFIVAGLQVMSKDTPRDVSAMKSFLEAFKSQRKDLEAGVEETIREAEIALEEVEKLQQKQIAKVQEQIERKAEQVRMSVKVMRAEQAQIAEEKRIATAEVQEKIEFKAAAVREMTKDMRVEEEASAEVQEKIEHKAASVREMTKDMRVKEEASAEVQEKIELKAVAVQGIMGAMRAQIAKKEEQASVEAEAIAAEQLRIAREAEVSKIEEQKMLEEEAYYIKVAAEARAAVEQQEREMDAIAALKAIESELSPEEMELWDATVELAELLNTNSEDESSLEGGEEPVNGSAAKPKDWSALTVVKLKEELRSRGLKVSGRKAELIERLMESS